MLHLAQSEASGCCVCVPPCSPTVVHQHRMMLGTAACPCSSLLSCLWEWQQEGILVPQKYGEVRPHSFNDAFLLAWVRKTKRTVALPYASSTHALPHWSHCGVGGASYGMGHCNFHRQNKWLVVAIYKWPIKESSTGPISFCSLFFLPVLDSFRISHSSKHGSISCITWLGGHWEGFLFVGRGNFLCIWNKKPIDSSFRFLQHIPDILTKTPKYIKDKSHKSLGRCTGYSASLELQRDLHTFCP